MELRITTEVHFSANKIQNMQMRCYFYPVLFVRPLIQTNFLAEDSGRFPQSLYRVATKVYVTFSTKSVPICPVYVSFHRSTLSR